MANDYTDLIRRVPVWLYSNNRSLVGDMPDIVEQAHDQLINVLDHDLFKTIIDGKQLLVGDGGILDLSTEDPRVLEIRSLRIKYRGDDDWTPIYIRDLEMLTTLYARNRPKRPLYYAEYSSPLVIKAFPAPREDFDIQITANVEPVVLSAAAPTNIISEQAFRAIEKATFRQAAMYMKDWEAVSLYEKEMQGAVMEVNAAIQRRRRDETEERPKEAANVSGQ